MSDEFSMNTILRSNSSGKYKKLVQQGFMCLWKRQFEKALEYFDKVLENEPYNYNALLSKSEALFQLDRIDEADACLDKILAREPNDPGVLYKKHRLHSRIGNYKLALYWVRRTFKVLGTSEEEIAKVESALKKDWRI